MQFIIHSSTRQLHGLTCQMLPDPREMVRMLPSPRPSAREARGSEGAWQRAFFLAPSDTPNMYANLCLPSVRLAPRVPRLVLLSELL